MIAPRPRSLAELAGRCRRAVDFEYELADFLHEFARDPARTAPRSRQTRGPSPLTPAFASSCPSPPTPCRGANQRIVE